MTDTDSRTQLRQELAGRSAPSLRPASLNSTQPIRPVPGPLQAKLEARRMAGFTPVTGANHPRRERLQWFVAFPLVVAAFAVVISVIAHAMGHHKLSLVTAIVAVVGVVVAAIGRSWVRADPLRITTTEGRLLDRARCWQSQQPWTAAMNAGPERALLGMAVEVVGTIATSQAWMSVYLDGHRSVLDLAVELDSIDVQLCQVAAARLAGAEVDAAFDSALDRVVALRRYHAGLLGLGAHITATAQVPVSAPVEQTWFAGEGMQRLIDDVNVITTALDSTAVPPHQDRSL